jgi:2-dehydro-3-deoxyphosphogluconate aldolase / (4S)-4-hydroxy-2-oxoglutarate aldolase
MQEIIQRIEKEKVAGIIRTATPEQAYQAALAAIKGGLKLVEITLTIPDGYSVIGDLAHNKDILVAAGTILNADMAELAIEAGAQWIISPHTDPEIISYCRYRHICVSAGALSPNEVFNAWNLGSDIVKVFPIHSMGGPSHIRSLLDPLPFLKLMPTGSVSADTALEYLEAGAVAVGIGATIFDKQAIQNGNYEIITEKTHQLVTTVEAWYATK